MFILKGEEDGRFPIVGIGSSAGGLEALEKLFGAMPPDSGLGFVVVAHLDPTQESHLSELLSPGHQDAGPRGGGEDRGRARPRLRDRARPGPHAQGRRAPSQQAERGAGHRRPVDTFFRSLAENGGKRAIGIVLSGTGTDGAQGLRAIKAEGGITLAQDPETADFAGMPQSAITTGAADLVLAPEKMAEALLDLGNPSYCGGPPTWGSRPRSMVSSPQCCPSCAPEPSRISAATRGPLSSAASTAAWASSKWQIVGLDDYIERLRNDPDELAALARDLTITVSGFFRDPEAWKVLDQKVIAPLVEERPAGAPIRVWVPGCATGEEAYSIAMLIVERAEAVQKSFDLKIFATDVSDHVLPAARACTL